MFKVKHHQCPTYVSDLFNLNSSGDTLRNANFTVPKFNTVTFGKHSIRHLGPVLPLKRSKEDRILDTLQAFKNRIALMCDDIALAKITSKLRFDNAKCTFYHETIPKAAKMKKQHEGNENLRKCRANEACW